MPAPDNSREERKQMLRDWMTGTLQLTKVKVVNTPLEPRLFEPRKVTSSEIATMYNQSIPGLKMTEKWVDKALYGAKGKPK